jgi:hypothetical protein
VPAPAFAPSPPTDLVLPNRGSSTARAVASLARRKLFDWVKSVEIESAEPGLGEVRAMLSSLLPGQPKRVAEIVDAPSVSAPLRLLRAGAPDPSMLGRVAADAVRRRLDGARDEGEVLSAAFMSRDAVVAESTSPFLLRWPGAAPADLHLFFEDVRTAHALLRASVPGLAEALERVARAVVPTGDTAGAVRVEAHAPAVFGLGQGTTVEGLARGLARATSSALLFSLRELDMLGDDVAFSRLLDAASAAADSAVARELAFRRSPGADTLARASFVAAFRDLEGSEDSFTPVGRGVFRELARHAGYAPPREPKREEDE